MLDHVEGLEVGGPQEDTNLKFRKEVGAGYRDFGITITCIIVKAGMLD